MKINSSRFSGLNLLPAAEVCGAALFCSLDIVIVDEDQL